MHNSPDTNNELPESLEMARLRRENAELHRQLMEYRQEQAMVGESAAARGLLELVAGIAATDSDVLLCGEPGTGKERIARLIHEQSDRRSKPFIKLSCASLSEGLVEQAIFGQENDPAGASFIDRAVGGTLLLDEISALGLEHQTRLHRTLEGRPASPGGMSGLRLNVRLIATSSRDLSGEVAAGRFCRELYDNVAAVVLSVPPLRERPEDIAVLAHKFAMLTASAIGKEFSGIAPEAVRYLRGYTWPGNVSELRHAVERAVVVSTHQVLLPSAFEIPRMADASLLPPGTGALHRTTPTGVPITVHGSSTPSAPPNAIVLTSYNVDEAERILIERALQATGNNRTRTAQLLGISVRTLRNKLNGPGGKANRMREVA
ncbi:MAG: sigma-54-dependent transcriptional regulator [Gemmatimonadaceae bacterium]